MDVRPFQALDAGPCESLAGRPPVVGDGTLVAETERGIVGFLTADVSDGELRVGLGASAVSGSADIAAALYTPRGAPRPATPPDGLGVRRGGRHDLQQLLPLVGLVAEHQRLVPIFSGVGPDFFAQLPAAHEHQRSAGIGGALVHAVLDAAAAAPAVVCDWRTTNRVAARFWRRWGFTPVAYRLRRTIAAP